MSFKSDTYATYEFLNKNSISDNFKIVNSLKKYFEKIIFLL